LASNITNPVIPKTSGEVLSTSTSTAGPTQHTVVVGGLDGGLSYDPTNITANIGDTVVFIFRVKNDLGAILVLVFFGYLN
jgi:plastocyanin